MTRKFFVFVLLFCLALPISAKEVPSGGEMLADILLARPLGLVSVVLGTGLFIISSPFTAISRTMGQTSNRLIIYPLKFTFVRGLGDFPGYMDELELVRE